MREIDRPVPAQRRAILTGPVRPPGRGVRCPLELRPRLEARFQSPGKPPSVHGIRQTGPLRPGGLSCRAMAIVPRAYRARDRYLGDGLGAGECG
jgi:hypothetical protein